MHLLIFVLILPFATPAIIHLALPRENGRTVETPLFPSSTNNIHLTWVLHAAEGKCIQFALKKLAISGNGSCFDGYLAIFDGPFSSSPLIFQKCNTLSHLPSVLYTTGNTLHIAFYSESSANSRFLGFAMQIECSTIKWSDVETVKLEIPTTPDIKTNNFLLRMSMQPQIIVSTPAFDASEKDVRLKWLISTQQSACIQFTLKKLAIDYQPACYSGFLAVYDGEDQNWPLLMRLCGAPSNMPPTVVSRTNNIFLAFYSAAPGISTQMARQHFAGIATATQCQSPVPLSITSAPTSTAATATTTTIADDYDFGPSSQLVPQQLPSIGGITAVSFDKQVVCGYPFFKPVETEKFGKIVGGDVAGPNSWPWQASLHYQGRHICGACLISPLHLITASHCFASSTDPQLYTVYLGKNSRGQWEPGTEQKLNVATVITHPDYGRTNKYDSDIAIIRLKEPGARMNAFVSPICLPRRAPPSGSYCYVTGYGRTMNTGGDGLLKQAVVPIMSNADCKTMDNRIAALLTEKMMCAGYQEGGQDSCTGDSGGPLACNLGTFPHFWSLNGIVSFGFSCAEQRAPGIYTRIGKFVPWILQYVNDLPGQYRP